MLDKNYTPIKTDYQSQSNIIKPQEIIPETPKEIGIISGQTPPKYIRKKYKFNKFLKVIKKGGYTSARLIAQSLDIDKDTILSWTNHPRVIEALGMDIVSYVKDIKKSHDWKAKAYLLDKLTPQDNTTNIQVNTLEGLTIIRR